VSAETWSLQLVHEVATWSLRLAPAIAVIGAVVTRSLRFPAAFAIGAAFDLGTVSVILRRVETAEDSPLDAARVVGPLIGARLAVKAVLLGLAAALPAVLDLWGMFAGVLVFDLTLMTVGSYKAATETFQ
jgi:hypothetical protein